MADQKPNSSNPSPLGPSRTTLEHTGLGDSELQSLHSQLLREKSEPSEGFAPTPLYLVFLIAALSFWAGLYLIHYSSGFDMFTYDETIDPTKAAAAATVVEFDPIKAGETFYRRNCVACHQANGMGVPGAFPPLVASEWVYGSDERLIKILLHGMAGPITVKGNQYNGNMPAFSASKDRDIAAVLTWIRTTEAFQNNAEPITEERVAEVRAAVGARSQPWSGPELEAQYK